MDTPETTREKWQKLAFSQNIMGLLFTLALLIAMWLMIKALVFAGTTEPSTEISTKQYSSIQDEVVLGGEEVKDVVRSALGDNKITGAEYDAIKAAAANITKEEVINKIKADTQKPGTETK